MPGAAAEGTRAVWALDQVKVYDGGPDGDADTDGRQLAVRGAGRVRAVELTPGDQRHAAQRQHHPHLRHRCGRSPSTTAARPTVVIG